MTLNGRTEIRGPKLVLQYGKRIDIPSVAYKLDALLDIGIISPTSTRTINEQFSEALPARQTSCGRNSGPDKEDELSRVVRLLKLLECRIGVAHCRDAPVCGLMRKPPTYTRNEREWIHSEQ